MEKLSVIDEVNQYLAEGKIVKLEVQEQLKEKVKSVEDFIAANKNVSTLSEKEKDDLYKESTVAWHKYVDFLKDIDYAVELKGEVYHYIYDLVTKDLHYNETDVFIAIKFKENFLDVIDELQKIKRDNNIYTINVKINDLTLLHHLMKNESVKGLGKKSYYFRDVVAMIGKIYKIFNVWNKESEEISTKILNWTQGLEPAAEVQKNPEETVSSVTV